MSDPSPRQVLYALVAGGFVGVVLVLTLGAAASGITPIWWTIALSAMVLIVSLWMMLNWQKTATMLTVAIGLFVLWLVGTLLTAV